MCEKYVSVCVCVSVCVDGLEHEIQYRLDLLGPVCEKYICVCVDGPEHEIQYGLDLLGPMHEKYVSLSLSLSLCV